MASVPDTIWNDCQPPALQPLSALERADFVIIGAGVAGLTCTACLTDAGMECMVVDAAGIGSGMTARSTAHISAAVDGGWRKMVPRVGLEAAILLAQFYSGGIEAVAEMAEGDCDQSAMKRIDGELLGEPIHRDTLEKERDAARVVGLAVSPINRSETAKDLLSVRFARQGRLHPLKYVSAIAKSVMKVGTPILRAELKHLSPVPDGILLRFEGGVEAIARRAVILAHNIALNLEYPRVKINRRISYVIAASVPAVLEDTITWDLARPYHYTRLASRGGAPLILVGGEDQPADRVPDPDNAFGALERWMRKRFPCASTLQARWWGEIKQTSDSLPIIGRVPGRPNVYVLDGDTGLGINHAMLGGRLIRDSILGRPNPLTRLFDPARAL